MTTKNKLKLLYKTITEQIEIAKEKYQQAFMVYRWFQCKDRKPYPGNKETVSKGGKHLKRIIKKSNLNI